MGDSNTPVSLPVAATAAAIAEHMHIPMHKVVESLSLEASAVLVRVLRSAGYLPQFQVQAGLAPPTPAVPLDRSGRTPEESWRNMLHPAATFRSDDQRQALMAVASAHRHVLLILPTGSGKFLYVLTAARNYDTSTDVTVVVVPYAVLAANHVATAARHGVPAVFHRGDATEPKKITAVTPEGAASESFHQLLRQLKAAGRLRRIVVDEGHSWLTEVDFRPAMLDCSKFACYGVPLIIMSATLPPTDLDTLLQRMRLADIASPLTIRGPSTRATIRYYVDELPKQRWVEHVQTLAMRLLPEEYKGLVFVRTRAEADDVAAKLSCESFHSGKDQGDLQTILQNWESGVYQLLVATTLLGAGYHTENVRLVVHWGPPHNYIAYSQATGRAGRNETYAEAHTLLDPIDVAHTVGRQVEFGHAVMMQHFSEPATCLREGMETYLDGRGEPCASHPQSHVPCARCDPLYIPAPPGEPPMLRTPPAPRARPSPPPGAFPPEVEVNFALLLNARLAQQDEQQQRRADEQVKKLLARISYALSSVGSPR